MTADLTLRGLMSCLVGTGEIVRFFLLSKLIITILPSALAFCDFDKLQDVRRKMMKKHTFPNAGSDNWAKLDQVRLNSD